MQIIIIVVPIVVIVVSIVLCCICCCRHSPPPPPNLALRPSSALTRLHRSQQRTVVVVQPHADANAPSSLPPDGIPVAVPAQQQCQ